METSPDLAPVRASDNRDCDKKEVENVLLISYIPQAKIEVVVYSGKESQKKYPEIKEEFSCLHSASPSS